MPGRYEHRIELNIDKSGLRTRIELASPCEELAYEVNSEIGEMVNRLDKGSKTLIGEIAHLSRELQTSALTSYGSNKTGTLVGSITEEVSGNSASVGTDLFYAEFVNDGRGSVSGSPILHFYADGEEVFVRSVGPSSPRPYLDDSGRMLEVQIDAIVGSYIDSV